MKNSSLSVPKLFLCLAFMGLILTILGATAAYADRPSITQISVSPSDPVVEDTVYFSATVTDAAPEGGTLTVGWYLDGGYIGGDSFTIDPWNPNYSTSASYYFESPGSHTVTCYASDGTLDAERENTFTVLPSGTPTEEPTESPTDEPSGTPGGGGGGGGGCSASGFSAYLLLMLIPLGTIFARRQTM